MMYGLGDSLPELIGQWVFAAVLSVIIIGALGLCCDWRWEREPVVEVGPVEQCPPCPDGIGAALGRSASFSECVDTLRELRGALNGCQETRATWRLSLTTGRRSR